MIKYILHIQYINMSTKTSIDVDCILQDIKSCSRYLEEEAESYGEFLVENADNITAMCNVIKNATGVDATAATLASMFDKLACEVLMNQLSFRSI